MTLSRDILFFLSFIISFLAPLITLKTAVKKNNRSCPPPLSYTFCPRFSCSKLNKNTIFFCSLVMFVTKIFSFFLASHLNVAHHKFNHENLNCGKSRRIITIVFTLKGSVRTTTIKAMRQTT